MKTHPPHVRPIDPDPQQEERRRRSHLMLLAVAALVVFMPFSIWKATWFGGALSDEEIALRLRPGTGSLRDTQHALEQISRRIMRNDPGVEKFYPEILRLAEHADVSIRKTVAWVMGEDNQDDAFHRKLLDMLHDEAVAVRQNAALALSRFGEKRAREELQTMLQPYWIVADVSGTVEHILQSGKAVGVNAPVITVRQHDGQLASVRTPIKGFVTRCHVAEGDPIQAGDRACALAPGIQQVWEALRALYLLGGRKELDLVESFAAPRQRYPEEIRHQARLTAMAIRKRMEDPDW